MNKTTSFEADNPSKNKNIEFIKMLLVLITKSKAVLKIFETFTGKQLR